MILFHMPPASCEALPFLSHLAEETGHRVCVVSSGAGAPRSSGPHERLHVTRDACEAIGLHCPQDFQQRNRDYAVYLASREYTHERFFWFLDGRVRICQAELHAFFSRFEGADDVDLIAGRYRVADRSWTWARSMTASRRDKVWRCEFGVVRLSRVALDVLLSERRREQQHLLRRARWPNDECFVPTVLDRAGLHCADLNDFGAPLFDAIRFEPTPTPALTRAALSTRGPSWFGSRPSSSS